MRTTIVLGSLLLLACSSDRKHTAGVGDGSVLTQPDFSISSSDGGDASVTTTAAVYAHASTSLFSVDPDTLAITNIGPFQWPNGSDTMTDIAIDKAGNMIGISYTSIYSVDKATAKCKHLSDFAGTDFNGLSFIANMNGGTEALVGADAEGDLYTIDPTTGAQTQLGSYGSGFGSSGDLVSVEGSTFATVTGSTATDLLVRVDNGTGKATVVGETGFSGIWGLGYWKQKVFGFTESDGMITIDIVSGKGTSVPSTSTISWYGAGVTTAAPITIN